MKLIKHIGKLKNKDTKVLVVFMQLPEDKTNSLIVETHSLPDLVQDEIMRLIETDECQKEKDLGTFLSRKTLSNGSAGSILTWLHKNGKLSKVPVSSVIMVPHPGHPIALSDLLTMMETEDKKVAESVENKQLITASTEEEKVSVAKGLLLQAELLKEEAAKLEKKAHDLMGSCPAVKPAKTTRKSKKTKTTEV